MQWEDLLGHLDKAGLPAVEDDYVDDYGQLAARRDPRLKDRFFRCTMGRMVIDGSMVEAYRFASGAEAEDFLVLMRDVYGRWTVHGRLVLHAPDSGLKLLDRIVEALGPDE